MSGRFVDYDVLNLEMKWLYEASKDRDTKNIYEDMIERIKNMPSIYFPCSIDTPVFEILGDGLDKRSIHETVVKSLSLQEDKKVWVYTEANDGLTMWYSEDDFGKSVFLTKDEAEEYLKENY